ncbi:hypothetical protein D3C85_1446530 [compost metagenome]
MGVKGYLRMGVRTEVARPFNANCLETKRCTLRRASDDTDVLDHVVNIRSNQELGNSDAGALSFALGDDRQSRVREGSAFIVVGSSR